jgi:Ca2+-binding RTX toxin-like protein
MAKIVGTAADDTRIGTDAGDLINLRQGNDRGSGLRGDDSLRGGAGGDHLVGGRGDDLIRGDNGRDWVEGGAGDDSLFGGHGRDRLEGGAGGNRLSGGDGIDRFVLQTTDEAPFGMTVRQFDEATSNGFEGDQLIVSAIADGGADVIIDAAGGEHVVIEAGFSVEDMFFSITLGSDGDGDGEGGDIFGVVGFYGPAGAASLKLILLPDQFDFVDLAGISQSATGAGIEFLGL